MVYAQFHVPNLQEDNLSMKPRNAKTNDPITHIMILIDASSSMCGWERETTQAHNRIIDEIQRLANPLHDTVSTYLFHSTVERIGMRQSINSLRPWGSDDYRPHGNTVLYDAIVQAIQDQGALYAGKPDEAYLLYLITDGEDTASRRSSAQCRTSVLNAQSTDRWTFALQVPPGSTRRFENLGIPPGNIDEWEQTRQGFERARASTVLGTQSYYGARALGISKVESFYANSDASKLTPEQLRDQCVNVTPHVRELTVSREAEIRHFVESKLARPYVIGSGYYQLMKPERVQPDKQVLIQERNSRTIYGGAKARELVGIPPNVTVKVDPGNHGNYDIFVQSRSVNRKLPRGTKVLVDVAQTRGLIPTWDHTKF